MVYAHNSGLMILKRHKQLHSEMLSGQQNNNSRCSNKLCLLSHFLHCSCLAFHRIIRSHCLHRPSVTCLAFEFTFYKCNRFCARDTLENLVAETSVKNKGRAPTQTATHSHFARHPNICLRAKRIMPKGDISHCGMSLVCVIIIG